jgi:hypothetical protein
MIHPCTVDLGNSTGSKHNCQGSKNQRTIKMCQERQQHLFSNAYSVAFLFLPTLQVQARPLIGWFPAIIGNSETQITGITGSRVRETILFPTSIQKKLGYLEIEAILLISDDKN